MRLAGISSFIASMLVAAGAQAALIEGATLSRNECAGFGFSTCYATTDGTQGRATTDSWQSLYKRNSDGSTDVGSIASVNGSEFGIVFDSRARSLSFTYTPGVADPEIHAFVVFQAGRAVLFYDPVAPITSATLDMGALFGRQGGGWSHLTFFGGPAPVPPPVPPAPTPPPVPDMPPPGLIPFTPLPPPFEPDPDVPVVGNVPVPAPAGVVVLLVGLAGLFAARRYRPG